jgi:replicative DNA helicase
VLSLAAKAAQEAGVELEPAKPAKKLKTAGEASPLFDLANGVPMGDVLSWLGLLDGDQPKCPGCGETDAAVVIFKNGLKCQHDRCMAKGVKKGFRTPVDVVMEAKSLQHVEAALAICERFGIKVPEQTEKAAQSAHIKTHDDWEPPTPLDHHGPLPEFPVDCLPPVLRAWVEAEAEATQTPPELAACVALGVLSACAAGSFEVEVRPGYVEPIQLFTLATMGPGERKSSVFADAIRPLREYERALAIELGPKIVAAQTKRKILELRHQEAVKKAVKTGDGLDAVAAEELANEHAEFAVPAVPRLVADDTTPERLASLLGENGGRIAVMSPEGGLFETIAGRYSDGVSNIDTLLKGHAGDALRVDRQNRAPVIIDRPVITLALCVQPDVLHGLANKPSFRGRGLLARFLYALPQSKMGRRLVAAPPVPAAVTSAYEAMCRRLLAGRNADPVRLTLEPGALSNLEAFAAELEPRLGPDGDLASVRDWAGKLVGATVRISALLHLAERHSEDSGNIGSCGQILSEKRKIALFFLSHSLAAFNLMGSDPSVELARTALAWIRRSLPVTHNSQNPQNSFTKRDLFQGLKGTLKTADAADPVLKLLEDHGYIRLLPAPPTRGAGRPPSPRYEVNPRWSR